MRNSTILASAAVATLMWVLATPVEADYSTGSAMRANSATRLYEPELLAWCGAMGGYPSFEAQARAKARAQARAQASRAQASRAQASRAQAEARRGAEEQRGQVEADQSALKSLGYYNGKLDGQPGRVMKDAIADFRKANDLGIGTKLDAKSREVLHGGNALSKATRESSEKTQEIQADQQALADLRYYDGAVDGLQNPKTLAAIRKFKQEHGFDASNDMLDGTARAALREAQDEVRWLRSANGDGVSIIMAKPHNGAYRMRMANGDYFYEAEGASKVQTRIEKILRKSDVQKVYIDVSELSAKSLESFKNTLRMRPKSSVHLLENAASRELVFSRNINVVEA